MQLFPVSLDTQHSTLLNSFDTATTEDLETGRGDGDVLLSTSSFMQLRRITERRLHAYRRLSSEVIVAVPWLSDEAGAADDDVCFERVTGAVDGVRDVAGPLACCWVAGGGG